jgi:very-short-patch-repair endonuclease
VPRGRCAPSPLVGEVAERSEAGGGHFDELRAIVRLMPHTNIDPKARSSAKRLRRDQTDAERKMWRLLRPFRDDGIPFRRQAPVGPYIVDFVWLGGRLAIEVDGGQHNESFGQRKDAERTRWLGSQGFEVLRFWNNEVMRNGEGCQQVIAEAVEKRRALSFLK